MTPDIAPPPRTKAPRGRRSIAPGDGTAAVGSDPLYVQMARVLRDEIVGGTHPVGAQLPTEDELCARFAVSRHTVREALRRLREDKLVSSRQGAGTVVLAPPSAQSYVHHAMSVEDLVAFTGGTRFAIETMRMVIVDARLAARIGVPPGEEWLAVTGLRFAQPGDVPVCWTEYYINREFAAVGRLLPRHKGPVFQLIEDLFARSVTTVEQEIGAAILSPVLAAGLRARADSAALEVRRQYRLADGLIAQVTVNVHPAALFRHAMTMQRVRT